jgi:CO/xanthine dehydrogenase FAD-binding subunit
VFAVEEYFEAKTLAEVLELLAEDQERQVIAGGTDLLVKMRESGPEKVKLVSIRNINALRRLGKAKTAVSSWGLLPPTMPLPATPWC